MKNVIVVIGSGSIGQAISRRVGAGNHVLLSDLRRENVDAAATILGDAGFETTTTLVDVSSRKSVSALIEVATSIGNITGLIHAAGVSPSQAPIEAILHVDLYGTALVRIPAKAVRHSGDGGHPRSAATQAGGLFTRLTAMGQGGSRLSHRLACAELDAVRVVDEPIEYGIGNPPTAQVFMPVRDG